MYKYLGSIYSQQDGKPFSKDFGFSYANPLLARRYAIQELKNILVTADNQLQGLEPNNRYCIPEWDSPHLIDEAPALVSMLVPFSVTLYWYVGDTEYALFGHGIGDTIEAMIAEGYEYKSTDFPDLSQFIELLEKTDYSPTQEYAQTRYLRCDGLQKVPNFDFIHHYILSEDSEFLLKDMAL